MPTLHWIGTEKVINHHLDVPYRVLEHQYGFEAANCKTDLPTNSGNKIIHGDNLEALKSLLPEYEGKVKCIYIDPPYNTGNEGWVYNDNVNDPKIKKWLNAVVGKEGEDLSRHDKWLCMMYPRLVLLHRLLAQDGVIFVSIDDNEQASLRLVMDEIFGCGNFVAQVIWQKVYSSRMDAKGFSKDAESLVVFAKSSTFSPARVSFEQNSKQFKKFDPDLGKYYRLRQWRKEGSSSLRNDRPNLFYPIEAPDGSLIFPIKPDKTEGRWRGNIEHFNSLLGQGLIDITLDKEGAWQINVKQLLEEVAVKPPSTFWSSEYAGHTHAAMEEIKVLLGSSAFSTPKPSTLIQRVLEISSDSNSIVLDSFSGSGTTAHAVLNLNKQDGGNRKVILIEMEDYAETITAERVKRVMQGYGEGKNAVEGTGGAFDYYTLGPALFDDEGNLNEAVGTDKIRAYVWYSETRSAFQPTDGAEPYLLGKADDAAYYFVYEPDALTCLDFDFLASMNTKAGQYVIYADNCLLTKEFLAQNNIVFKKIPRDISRF